MKNVMKYFFFTILIGISINCANAQEENFASNISKLVSPDGKQLVIKYDLIYPDTSQLFDVNLEINFADKIVKPEATSLSGAWGSKRKAAKENVVIWEFPGELKDYISKVVVKVIATKAINPLANFDFKIMTRSAPFDVKFLNKSKNSDTYLWSFGDSKSGALNISTEESPVHRFKKSGNYIVELASGSKNNGGGDTIRKTVLLSTGKEQEIAKHKKLRTIWLGSTVAAAGVGTFSFVKYGKTKDEWQIEQDRSRYEELEKKMNTYKAVGITAAVISGVCISQVVIQSLKIKSLENSISFNYIPVENGAMIKLAFRF